MVDKVALGQVFIRIIRFSLTIPFHRGFSFLYIVSEMNNRPVGGRGSETYPYSTHMNINNDQLKDVLQLGKWKGQKIHYLKNL
jgi:hypothetical protein